MEMKSMIKGSLVFCTSIYSTVVTYGIPHFVCLFNLQEKKKRTPTSISFAPGTGSHILHV